MEEEISLMELWDVLKKRLGIIVFAAVVGVIIAMAYTFFVATPKYQASTEILVNTSQGTENIQRSDIDTSISLINTYSDIIRNEVILLPVIEDLDLNETPGQLRQQINVSSQNNSQVFSVSVVDEDPEQAAAIANSISDVFQERITTIMNVDNVTVISPAVANPRPVSPRTTLNLVIGFVLGLAVGIGIALLREFTDTTIKSDEFIVEELGWTTLGRISEFSDQQLAYSVHDARVEKSYEEELPSRTRRR